MVAYTSIRNISSADLTRQPHQKPADLNPQCLEIVLSITSLSKLSDQHFNLIFSTSLSYDVASPGSSESEIRPCNKIDKPLVVYRFTGNVMTSITTLRT